MKTKIFALILALVLVCSFAACGEKATDEDNVKDSSADVGTSALTDTEPPYETAGDPVEGGTIKVDVSPIDGDVFNVTVSIVDNPGIAAFNLSLNYDNTKICPIEITEGELLGGSIVSNIQQSEEITATLTSATAFYYGASNFEGDGELFTMSFKALDVSSGFDITLTAEDGAFVNEALQDVVFNLESASVSSEGN